MTDYPFSVTFHGNDIGEVRTSILIFLSENVSPEAPNSPESTHATHIQPPPKQKAAPRPKARRKGKPKKSPEEKAAEEIELIKPPTEDAPAVSADADAAPGNGSDSKPNNLTPSDNPPEKHPDVSLAYNSALELLMSIYNGSGSGSYEVTRLLEDYRVKSFREIPEDRGVELLDKANELKVMLEQMEATKQ